MVGYLALAIAAAAALWGLGDRWWAATVLLFGPRWVLLLPLLLLLPSSLLFDRPLALPVVLSGIVIAGPVMGLRTGLGALLTPHQSSGRIRLASLNAQGGGPLFTSPANLLAEWDVDVAAFQECGPDLRAALSRLQGWYTDARSGLCLASRFEITAAEEMKRDALQFAGGSGLVVTYTLNIDGNPSYLTNLHLETPRAGFELIRAGRLREGIQKTREKSLLRDVELRRARIWVDRYQGPHIVMGDFNTPPESRSFRQAWGDWRNAFSLAGRGLGGTRLNGWIRARIDHILSNAGWAVEGSWVGEEVGSDHLPIFAELVPSPMTR